MAPGKGRKRPRDARKSFFHWFTDVQDEGADQIAEAIKDDLWASPLHFYLVSKKTNKDSYSIYIFIYLFIYLKGQIEFPEEDVDEYATESGDDDDVREVVVIGDDEDDDLEEEEEEEEEEAEEEEGTDGGQRGRDPVAEAGGQVYEVEDVLDEEEDEEEEEEEEQVLGEEEYEEEV